jgi:hypothetical protein
MEILAVLWIVHEWLSLLPWFRIILVLLMIVALMRLGEMIRQLYGLRQSVDGLREEIDRQLSEGGQAYRWLYTFSHSLLELRKVIGERNERKP